MEHRGEFVFLAWVTIRDSLCEDLRRHISSLTHTCHCRRCGAVTDTRRRTVACFIDGERLCFTCYHKSRWPK